MNIIVFNWLNYNSDPYQKTMTQKETEKFLIWGPEHLNVESETTSHTDKSRQQI